MKCIWCDTEVIPARIRGESLMVEPSPRLAIDVPHTRARCVTKLERMISPELPVAMSITKAARDVATDVVPGWVASADSIVPVSASKMRALRDALGIKL